MPSLTTLVDGTVPVASDFNSNFNALNNAIGSSTSISSYTTGDMLYASAANTLNKLPIGSAGQVLGISGGVPAWTASTATYTDHLSGLAMSKSGTDLQVAVGACASDDGTIANRINMTLASATVGKTAGTWVVGTNQNKLDAGTVANSTTYHVFVIERTDTSVVDILFSTSATAPTLPTNYTKQRRIGAFITDGAAAIRDFLQFGDYFRWKTPLLDISAATQTGATPTTRTLTVPTGVNVEWHGRITENAGTQAVGVRPVGASDGTPSISATPLTIVGISGAGDGTEVRCWTNTSAQVETDSSATITNLFYMATLGWLDRRGRG